MNAGRRAKLKASQGNAEMIFSVLRTEPTPRDAMATLSAVHAAMIWTQE